jgi:hypothetical protein
MVQYPSKICRCFFMKALILQYCSIILVSELIRIIMSHPGQGKKFHDLGAKTFDIDKYIGP